MERDAPLHRPRFSCLHAYTAIYTTLTCFWALAGVLGTAWGLAHGSPPALLLSAAALAFLAGTLVRRLREFRAFLHIPGPRPSLFLGNLSALLAREHGGRDRALLELHRVHGPVVRLHMGWGCAPFVSLARVSQNLTRKDVDSNRRADSRVLGRSLMGMAQGPRHADHRREVQALLDAPAVAAGAPRMRAIAERYLAAWRSGSTRHGSLKADLHHWSAHTLGAFLCGDDWDTDADLTGYLAAIAALEETISVEAFHPWFARWIDPARRARARTGYAELFDLFAGKLARRRARGAPGDDALGRMAALAGTWSHAECVEELISLVAGGTDAMSYTTAQALVLLANDQGVLADVRASLPAAPGQEPGRAVLHVLAEAMRLYPAVPFSSKVVPAGGVVEDDLFIPAGTNLMWMKTAVGRNEQVFREPERFMPRRFAGPPEQRESIARALPFGAGPRHCPGRRLAEVQCGSLLGSIVAEFDLEPLAVDEIRFSATVSVTPSAVPVRLVPRHLGVARARPA